MVKKVVFVLSLFLFVDRVMYYKLGQGFHQTRHAFSSACAVSYPYHEQKELLKKKRIRERVAFYTKSFFTTLKNSNDSLKTHMIV